ncbi:MAG: YceI family protein [Flavobacteriaceae bacterium]|nr:YceI family protein [Flavobacteriaceae bacterium]
MKSLLYPILIALFLTPLTYAQTETTTPKQHPLQVASSIIHWKGHYMFQVSEHTGTVLFKEGYLLTTNGHVSGGSFVIDMTTITNPEHEERGHGPVTHLKDPDFFYVSKYPEAKLTITQVEFLEEENIHRIYANLTIKNVTKPMKFYAKVDGTTKQMTTRFKIDRTRWGITYNNKLKDEAISDAIEFDVTLQF